jgi:2-desacetyl-2-hydroxyethyl bacteriochlorophyllide A dehydrogenase
MPIRLPPLGSHDVLLSTLYSGISSGTDKWVMQGRFTWSDLEFPLVPGYQRSAIVEAVGSGVRGMSPGQLVVATRSNNSPDAISSSGAHLSLGVSVASDVHDATGISPLVSSFVVSAQVGFNAASRITAPAQSRVVVIGDGIIGASSAMCAAARGYQVLLVGHRDGRLAAISSNQIVTANGHDFRTRRQIEEWRPSAIIDTVQTDDAFALYVGALAVGYGEIVFNGHSPDGAEHWASMAEMQRRELTAHFVSGWTTARLQATLQLMREGRLPLEQLVGVVATTQDAARELTHAVIAGELSSVAAAIDWRAIRADAADTLSSTSQNGQRH